MGQPLKVGIIGAGTISEQYLVTLARLAAVEVVAIADLDAAKAENAANRHGIRPATVEAMLADTGVDLVLNLTIPAAHADIALRAIAAGKWVYGEKPIATDRAAARFVLASAASAGVRVGFAPDTVLGTGIQTARRALDDGLIGRPISATATMAVPGHELWHPNPDFYYQPGGGPLLDMGPYYISALVTLLGPVVSVIGASSRMRAERLIASGPRAGETIPVGIDTHVSAVLTHASGTLSTVVMSFDAVATRSSKIEVHGDRASLAVPDPNLFEGDVLLRALGEDEWSALSPSGGYREAGRGFGIADLAATPADAEPRAGGALALHVLDVMLSVLDSAELGARVPVTEQCERPPAVPLGHAPGGLRTI